MTHGRIFILILLCTTSCTTTAVQKEGVAEHLSYLIGPVSENRADYIGALSIAKCVANESKAVIPKNNYSGFAVELKAHVAELQKFLVSFQAGHSELLDYPKKSGILDSFIAMLVPTITACERKIGVNVEF